MVDTLKIVQALKVNPSEFFRDLEPDRKFDLINTEKAIKDASNLKTMVGLDSSASSKKAPRPLNLTISVFSCFIKT